MEEILKAINSNLEILVNENYEEQAKKINEENVKKSKKQSKKYEVIGIKTENETSL